MVNANGVLRFVVCLVLTLSSVPALAKAHCWCKLGPVSAPYYNFGAIGTYGTQIGHDNACMSLCDDTSTEYLRNPLNQATVCSLAQGADFYANFAVGTKAYKAGKSFTCSPKPRPGLIVFRPGFNVGRNIYVNGKAYDTVFPPATINVQNIGFFTTFGIDDWLAGHVQRWTYSARLYRDGLLVDEHSAKSPIGFSGNAIIRFRGQSNSAVHGHTWKIEWQYLAPGYDAGSVTFFVP